MNNNHNNNNQNSNKNMSVKKVLTSRKFKYGTSALVFTVVFVAAIILVNVLVSFVDSKTGGLYVDLTTKQLYSVSNATRDALKNVEKPVEIIFSQPADKCAEDDMLNSVKMLAESYEKEFNNVTVIFKDRKSDPAYFNQFKKSSADMTDTNSIIIHCPSNGRSVIYDKEQMYKRNQYGELFAFNGEYKITSAILSTARTSESMLRAGMITGHNELSLDSVKHTLEDYGYEVSDVNLMTISQEELGTYDLLLVCDPVSDFVGMSNTDSSDNNAANESAKLLNYVVNDLGNVMFFLDPIVMNNCKELPELYSLISDGFGVEVDNLQYIKDPSTILSDYAFYGSYAINDTASAGYAMHKPVSESSAGLPPVFYYSCALNIPKENDDGFNITPVMTVSDGGVQVTTKDGEKSAANTPIMTLSKYTKIENNKEVSGNVIVCGSTGFLLNLETSSSANGDLFKQMLVTMGNDKIIVDIDYKVLDETKIDVPMETVKNMAIRLAVIVPTVIIIIGVAVFIKRKYFNGK